MTGKLPFYGGATAASDPKRPGAETKNNGIQPLRQGAMW